MTSDAGGVEVLGWSVDNEPCDQCREVQYGVRIYVMTADGEITSVWYCGETSAVRDWMQRAMHLSST